MFIYNSGTNWFWYTLGKVKQPREGSWDRIKQYQCLYCGYCVARQPNYKEHMAHHSPSPDWSHMCPYCGYQTRSMGTVRRHIFTQHNGETFWWFLYSEFRTMPIHSPDQCRFTHLISTDSPTWSVPIHPPDQYRFTHMITTSRLKA